MQQEQLRCRLGREHRPTLCTHAPRVGATVRRPVRLSHRSSSAHGTPDRYERAERRRGTSGLQAKVVVCVMPRLIAALPLTWHADYFYYCEAGFASRILGDAVLTFTREGDSTYGCGVYA